jgi:hypothetical protein
MMGSCRCKKLKKLVMRNVILYMVSLCTLLTFAACQSDDTDFSGIIDCDSTETEVTPMTIAIDSTTLNEGTEIIPGSTSEAAYNDYIENNEFAYTVNIAYSESSVALSGDVSRISYTSNGADLTVKSLAKETRLVVSGSSSDGSLKVYSDYKYALILNGLTLTNPSGAAINNQCGKSVYVVLADGTTNRLADGTTYSTVSGEDQKAAFFSEGQMAFSGSGMLKVYAQGKNGIASDDYIRFRPGNRIYVNSTVSNGIKANDGIFIGGGVVNVEVSAAGAKGLNSESNIVITGGRTTVITSGDSKITSNDTTSASAVKCDSTFTISAGILNVKSTGDGGKGIHADEGVNINGGEVNVVTLGTDTYSSPKGIKSDKNISITAGCLYSYSAKDSPLSAGGSIMVSTGYTTYENKDRYVIIKY